MLAKEPVPGRVKTRLCPPLTPRQAAAVAAAALADTLTAAVAAGGDRVLLVLEGRPGSWCPPGISVVPQAQGPLDVRLAAAWCHAGTTPALQIGMDTPQVGADGLAAAMAALAEDGVDAVLGPAVDGGWWAAGMRHPDPSAFLGIPTSRPDTGARQRRAFEARGWRVRNLAPARDIDTWADAVAAGYAP